MVQRVLIVFPPETQVVRPFGLGHVDDTGVLVVAELEGAAGVGVSDIGDSGDLKARNAFVVRADAVGARNFQDIGSVIAILRIAVGADVLPGIADVAVDQQCGRKSISEARRRHLHAATGMTGVAAVKGVAARLTEDKRRRRCPWEKYCTGPTS